MILKNVLLLSNKKSKSNFVFAFVFVFVFIHSELFLLLNEVKIYIIFKLIYIVSIC
jgi:hypothetical protein